MKYVIIILTIFTLIGKDIYQFSWDVYYVVHKTEIAQNQCENKAKPALKCNGKCYLMKQLKKAEIQTEIEQQQQKDKSASMFKLLKGDLAINFDQTAFTFELHSFSSEVENRFDFQVAFLSEKHTPKIQHPPAIS